MNWIDRANRRANIRARCALTLNNLPSDLEQAKTTA